MPTRQRHPRRKHKLAKTPNISSQRCLICTRNFIKGKIILLSGGRLPLSRNEQTGIQSQQQQLPNGVTFRSVLKMSRPALFHLKPEGWLPTQSTGISVYRGGVARLARIHYYRLILMRGMRATVACEFYRSNYVAACGL